MSFRPPPRQIAAVAIGLSSAYGSWLLLLYLRMIVSPAPQEMREGATVWITGLLLEGRNPYALSELPASANVYGIVYHLAVWPLALMFGNGFVVHRIVSGVSVAGACALTHRLLRREGADTLVTWTGVLMFFASSLYFVAPLARPDSLGLLLSMASITVLFRKRVTGGALAVGLVLALLALATKVYFAYPPFVLAAYMVLFGPRWRGLAYGLGVVSASVACLLGLTTVYPGYISLSLVANAGTTFNNGLHLMRQTSDWLVFSLPLTVALVALGGALMARPGRPKWLQRPSLFAFASVANATVFFGWLGWHAGAHMTYLFHLVTPVLIPALLPAVGQRPWSRAAVAVALPLALALNADYFPKTFARFTASEHSFAGIGSTVRTYDHVLGSTEVAGVLALAGRPVYDTGQSEYFKDAVSDRSVPGMLPAEAVRGRWESFLGTLEGDIAAERFDLIVRSRRYGLIPEDLVADHYHVVDTIEVDFAWSGQHWPVDFWRPGPAVDTRNSGNRAP